jgi:two-component system, response regulator FlrC
MRLLIIGRLSGELVAASKIAMQRGAAVTQADAVAQGLNVLRAKGADLIMIDVAQPIAQVEQDLILDTLDHCLGNRTHAAKILGISIRTLRNKLGEYTAAGAAVPEPGQARVMSA